MNDDLEYLRMENKKLCDARSELESNLSEEKEMVKYLHGVIKNYQQLLKKPDPTRHTKIPHSLKRSRNSRLINPRHLTPIKANTEDVFVKKVVQEMSNEGSKEKVGKGATFQSSSLVGNTYNHNALEYTSTSEDADRINTRGQSRRNGNFSTRSKIEDDIQADISSENETKFGGEARKFKSSLRNAYLLSATSAEAENVAETLSKHGRENVLDEMTKMLDSMLSKAVLYENNFKQKDKYLKKMERRYEYLASIALGEESECL